MIELLKDEAHPTPPPEHNRMCDRGIRHVAFTVADVEESWRILTETGCETLSEPIVSPDGKAKLFFARDPEGNRLELFVDTPWHVAQPLRFPIDLSLADDELIAWTEKQISALAGFQPARGWFRALAARLGGGARKP